MKRIPKCSCEESQHLRAALETIRNMCRGGAGWSDHDIVSQVEVVTSCALKLKPLGGIVAIGPIAPFLPSITRREP